MTNKKFQKKSVKKTDTEIEIARKKRLAQQKAIGERIDQHRKWGRRRNQNKLFEEYGKELEAQKKKKKK